MRIPFRESLLLLVLLLLALAGCTSSGLSLYEGGEWEYSNVVTLNAEQEGGAQGDEIRSLLAGRWEATSGEPVAFETKREVDGETTRYHIIARGTDFAQLAPYLSEPSAGATVRQEADGAVSLAIPLQAVGEPSVIFPTEGQFEFSLNAGQIISSNATTVEDGRAIWRSQDVRDRGLTTMEATVTAGARPTSQRPLLIGGGILAGLALLALAFAAGRSRSRAKVRTVEPLPPVTPPPPAPSRAVPPTERAAAPPPTERKP